MIKPQQTPNETIRLRDLEAYHILDTDSDSLYDDITMIASQLCGTPISYISFIDQDRVWLKSVRGLSVQESARDESFCGHTILNPNEILEVEDATKDERFYDNPFVTGSSNFKFYVGVPIVNENGSAVGTLCVVDRQPRKLSEGQRSAMMALSRQLLHLLELRREGNNAKKEANQKDGFLSMMSHEIRTPLNAIIGLTNILQKDNPTTEQRRTLNMLEMSGKNLMALLNDILDINKLGAGKLIIEKEPFNFKEVMSQLYQTYSFQTKERGLEFIFELDEQIPSYVKGDDTRILQILNNLLSNAIKFTEKGFVALKVYVLHKDEKEVRLSFVVRDSGTGIEKSKQDIIFDNFVQADKNIYKKYGGTGLGLSIVKSLLGYMGEEIRLDSDENEGAKFSFELTLACSNPPLKNPEMEKEVWDAKVLVVEDDKVSQLLLEKNLKKHGFEVVVSDNGHDALSKIESEDFDAIVVDLQLPGRNGLSAIEDIRKTSTHYKTATIIAVSAAATKDVRDSALEMGADDFIPKPHQPEILIKRIKKGLGQIS